MKKTINIIQLKKIYRILWPIKYNTIEYFSKRLTWLPEYSSHTYDGEKFILKLISKKNIVIRDYNHSDIMVYDQVFLQLQYGIINDILKNNRTEKIRIIDAGANVGFTSMYFAFEYDNIKILSIEPSIENYIVLEENIKLNNLENKIIPIRKALSNDSSKKYDISRSFRDALDWACVTEENKLGEISSITLNDVMRNQNWDIIDFLKIDIEGAEKEIFQKKTDLDILNSTKIIAIEIHDDVASRSEIEEILISFNFLIFNSGELTIGINRNLF